MSRTTSATSPMTSASKAAAVSVVCTEVGRLRKSTSSPSLPRLAKVPRAVAKRLIAWLGGKCRTVSPRRAMALIRIGIRAKYALPGWADAHAVSYHRR